MLRLLDPYGIIRVQSWDVCQGAPPKAEEVLGFIWPENPGIATCGRVSILCIGPADSLVLTHDMNASVLCDELNDAFTGSTFRATDVSNALARIQVKGVHGRALLAKGCSLDLQPHTFAPHRVARTRFAGMPMVVHCKEPVTFECIAPLSYRDYVVSWLSDAAREFPGT